MSARIYHKPPCDKGCEHSKNFERLTMRELRELPPFTENRSYQQNGPKRPKIAVLDQKYLFLADLSLPELGGTSPLNTLPKKA